MLLHNKTYHDCSPRFSSGGQAAVSTMVRADRRLGAPARIDSDRGATPPEAAADKLAPLDCTVGLLVMFVL